MEINVNTKNESQDSPTDLSLMKDSNLARRSQVEPEPPKKHTSESEPSKKHIVELDPPKKRVAEPEPPKIQKKAKKHSEVEYVDISNDDDENSKSKVTEVPQRVTLSSLFNKSGGSDSHKHENTSNKIFQKPIVIEDNRHYSGNKPTIQKSVFPPGPDLSVTTTKVYGNNGKFVQMKVQSNRSFSLNSFPSKIQLSNFLLFSEEIQKGLGMFIFPGCILFSFETKSKENVQFIESHFKNPTKIYVHSEPSMWIGFKQSVLESVKKNKSQCIPDLTDPMYNDIVLLGFIRQTENK